MPTSNCDKFYLLLWKNWTLQWNHKWQCLSEICAPVLFSLLLVYVRVLFKSTPIGELRFSKSFTMTDFRLLFENSTLPFDYQLAYSPASCTFCTNIMKEAGYQARIPLKPCRSSSVLEKTVAEEELLAGVDFGDANEHVQSYPQKFVFTIRFPSELRTSAAMIQIWNTNNLFMALDPFGPRNRLDEDGGIPPGYLREGFLTIQNQVSLAYIKQTASKQSATNPVIKIKRFPYPPFVEDSLLLGLAPIIALIILLCYIQPATYTVKYIALEKEKQLKEVLKIMGLHNWLHWSAWFVKAFITLSLSTLLIALFLTTRWTNDVAVITYSSFTAFIFFLLIYVITSITFCFMMATFFNKASTAAAVTALYWFISYIPFTYISVNYDPMPLSSKFLWCFIANTCMGMGTRIIVEWEMTGQGLNWQNIFEVSSAGGSLKMIHIIYMMLATAVIHMLICLYVEQVSPGNFGIPKPWNFPFRKSFWFGEPMGNISEETNPQYEERFSEQFFEQEPYGKVMGVEIRNLSRSFGKKQVVENLSFNMYFNEITVLLGHNGAGKTTTISMLIGMIQPTSGTAYINGHDIRTDIDGAREYLSICPQHNVLFDDLTVKDHLKFFAYLRGLRDDDLEDEVETYLEKIDLAKKENTLSANLSGGMQRKLSVSCALCGGPSVVLCDEPSSGMDPTARRQLWNILQQEKEGRVILLTTHFMDEADVLADRIAIMAAGELKCYGTSFYLKKKFGTGYTLVCVKEKLCVSNKVTEFLQYYIPNLELTEETDSEISYILEDKYSPIFPKVLNALENSSSKLNISGFGLSNASLEEVFLKMGAETFATDTTKTHTETENVHFGVNDRLKGRYLTCSQIQSMILKKYLSTRRNCALVLVNFAMLMAFVLLSVLVKSTDLFPKQRPVVIGLQQYKEATVVLESSNLRTGSMASNIEKNYELYVKNAGSKYNLIYTGGLPFEDYILSYPVQQQYTIDASFVAAATIRENEFLIWLNNKPLHSAPLTLNILHNAIAKTIVGDHAEIVVINNPLPYMAQTKMNVADTGLGLGTQLSTNVTFSMSIITALLCVFIIKERQSKAKLLQFVSGVKGVTFWLTHFIWDLIYLTILALVVVLFLSLFEEEAYTTFEELARNFVIFPFFAFSALPLTYLMSRWYAEPADGFAKLSMFNIFFGVGVFIIALVLSFEVLDLRDVGYSLENFALVYPHFALAKAMHSLYINQMLHNVCKPLLTLEDEIRCTFYEKCCDLIPYFAWERPGVGRPIVYMIGTGAFYSFLVISIQYRLTGTLWNKYKSRQARKRYTFQKSNYYDSDVDDEKMLIDYMTKEEIREYNLVLNRLTKFYGNFLAVNQISVAVKEAECFGLLGLNGAGKSTTFKMLTMDVRATFGTAYVKGMNIQTHTNAVYQEIGYCPQFGGLFNDFTGRETLRLFAMIHGIPKKSIAQLSENLAKTFGFIKHYDKQVGNYSGGNKRKLSTAVAVIGGPSVVLLDEPTSGMDPASRRRLWNVLTNIRKAGKSIVLTSHSMDECVALCTRLGIMVNGEFRCLGSIQHLRIKYSQGLILKIKVRSMKFSKMSRPSIGRRISFKTPTDLREKEVEIWVMENFPDATLEDRFQGLLSFNIPMSEKLWSRLFGKIEASKEKLFIEDYSITQTDLEDIFLSFSKR